MLGEPHPAGYQAELARPHPAATHTACCLRFCLVEPTAQRLVAPKREYHPSLLKNRLDERLPQGDGLGAVSLNVCGIVQAQALETPSEEDGIMSTSLVPPPDRVRRRDEAGFAEAALKTSICANRPYRDCATWPETALNGIEALRGVEPSVAL